MSEKKVYGLEASEIPVGHGLTADDLLAAIQFLEQIEHIMVDQKVSKELHSKTERLLHAFETALHSAADAYCKEKYGDE